MLEKIKEVPFIPESAAVKITSKHGRTVLERNDMVIWATEDIELRTEGIDCYVEAAKFFPLLAEIKEITQSTCLTVKLKNGAKYDLPFLAVSWEPVEMPTEYADTIMFKLDNLMLCTLKNLIKPELQCVYIDEEGAVTCDFISACISTEMTATTPVLLPPDVQQLVNNRLCSVQVEEDRIYINATNINIVAPNPSIAGDQWWESLRGMVTAERVFVDASKLVEGLKRLAMFEDYVAFDGRTALAGSNFEPFLFTPIVDQQDTLFEQKQFEIAKLAKILTVAKEMTEENGNIVLKNSKAMFLLSPMEEA